MSIGVEGVGVGVGVLVNVGVGVLVNVGVGVGVGIKGITIISYVLPTGVPDNWLKNGSPV